MMSGLSLSKQRVLKACALIIIFLHSNSLFAYEMACCPRPWRPVLSVAWGYLTACNIGDAQYFPIVNPVTDSFYDYQPSEGSKYLGFFDVFFGFEWVLVPDTWLLQVGLAYDQSVTYTVQGTVTQGADVFSQDSFTYQYDVSLKQLLLAGKLLGAFHCIYHPYIYGAVGSAFNRASAFSVDIPAFLTFSRVYDSNTEFSFSYALGVGIDVDLDNAVRLGMGYKFTDFGKVALGDAVIDTTPVSGTLSQSNVYSNELFIQATILLGI